MLWDLLDVIGTQPNNPYDEHARPEIDSMFSHTPSRLLDIGCSSGAVGKRLKSKYAGLFVWGVEIGDSARQAEECLDKVSRKTLSDFNKEEAELLFSIDTVLLLDVIEHIYNPWEFLCSLAKLLNPQAQIIVSLPNIGHANILRDLANGYWHYQASGLLDITHVRFFTLFEMRKMFYETGFRILRVNFSVEYCVDSEKYPAHAFPSWVDLGNVKISINNFEQFLSLNSRQIFFNLQPTQYSELSIQEQEFSKAPHPKTLAF